MIPQHDTQGGEEILRLAGAAIASCITPIALLGPDLRFRYANRALVDLLGYRSEEDLLGRSPLDHAADATRATRAVEILAATGTWSGEIEGSRVDGTRLEVRIAAQRVRPASDGEVRYVASVLDLTALRRAERALHDRDIDLTQILASVDDVVYRDWFRCGRPRAATGFVSPPVERLVGYAPEELVGRPELWLEAVHPDDRVRVRATLREARWEGVRRTFEYRVWDRTTGRYRWVEESVVPDAAGAAGLPGLFGTIRDVTERKRAEREKLDLQERVRRVALEWRQTFDSIELPIFLLRWDGRVRRLNRAALHLVEAGFPEVLNRPLRDLGEGEPWRVAGKLLERARHGGRSVFDEVRDEAQRTWQISLTPSASDEGSSRWLIAIFRDLTELYRLQESLRLNETMSAMGALVGRVAHEVRNPLFGISAVVDALQAEHGSDPELDEYLVILRSELDRMSRLMEDLLDYGRPVALQLTRGSLAEVLASAVQACRAEARCREVAIETRIPPDLPPIPLDANRLEQVFKNLVENALQHSPAGATMRIAADVVQGDETVVVVVADRGPGFRPEDLHRAAEPFFSRRPGGTGLGLWIVQRILAEHGGRLSLANGPEGGAVVRVRLPLEERGGGAEVGGGASDSR